MPQRSEPHPELQVFGANLRKARLVKGMSQDVFALDAGVHRTWIGHAERGTVNPTLLNITKVARALGVPAGSLLDGIDEVPPVA